MKQVRYIHYYKNGAESIYLGIANTINEAMQIIINNLDADLLWYNDIFDGHYMLGDKKF